MYSFVFILMALNVLSSWANPLFVPFGGDNRVVRLVAIPSEALRDYQPEESHPFESAVRVAQASAPMEVSDDDSYDETAPAVRVIAAPQAQGRQPRMFRLADTGARDLSALASHHDLQTAATGHGGYGPSGWLDMGAYSSGYGAFGWYADYPVGGGKGYGR